MIAIGGLAKAFPDPESGYDFTLTGAMETRFTGITWLQSNYRVKWRWDDEALYTDLDGSFTEQPFCAAPSGQQTGCHVLKNGLVSDYKNFPDCYYDWRYDGPVCKPNYNIVEAGLFPPDPLILVVIVGSIRFANRGTNGDGSGMYVRADDHAFLRNKWRPDGSYQLVEMDASTDILRASVVGQGDYTIHGSWRRAVGVWTAKYMASFEFNYVDRFTEERATRMQVAQFSADGSSLSWVNGTSELYGSRQLYTHVMWWRCEVRPEKCVGTTRYPDYASQSALSLNPANTLHHRGSVIHTQLVTGRRYMLDILSPKGVLHLEQSRIWAGQAMRAGEWVELATNSLGAYPQTHVAPGVRPLGSVPTHFSMNVDGKTYSTAVVPSDGIDAHSEQRRQLDIAQGAGPTPAFQVTSRDRRRLTTGGVTFDPVTEQSIIRLEGPPDCLAERWYDPCGGVVGEWSVAYAPPPSPPPPRPPSPPPPPPSPPPHPPPPFAPIGFAAQLRLQIAPDSLSDVTPEVLQSAVKERTLAALHQNERDVALFVPTVLVHASVTVSLAGDLDASLQEQVRALAEAQLCKEHATGCTVAVATSSRRRLSQQGTITLAIERPLYQHAADQAVGLAGPAEAEEEEAEEEQAAFFIGSSASVLDTANAVVAGFGETILSALGSQSEGTVVGSPTLAGIDVIGDVRTLGTDTNDLGSAKSTIVSQVASDVGVSVMTSVLSVAHPPPPPPFPPPLPHAPPHPPAVPPGSPSFPPADWFEPYYEDEGCDPACAGGCRRSRWSEIYTWHGQGLALGLGADDAYGWPGFKSNVTIPRCTTIILDVDINVQLFSLVVWGTLVVENRPDAQVSLRSVCIAVKCANAPFCGAIHAGTPTQPFAGRLEFLLSGDDLTESPQCGGMKGKSFDVSGGAELALYGDRPSQAWGRLRQTVERGDQKLYMSGNMDWRTGDQILIAVSGTDGSHTEQHVLTGTRKVPALGGGYDTELTLLDPIEYRHVAVTEQHGTHTLDMKTEVGLLLRPRRPSRDAQYAHPSIRIAGVDSNRWGFRFAAMRKIDAGLIFKGSSGSYITMHGVHMENGGAHKPSNVALRYNRKIVPMVLCYGACDLQRSVFVPKIGHALETSSTRESPPNLCLRNIFWKHVVAVRIFRTAHVLENLVFGYGNPRAGAVMADLPPEADIQAGDEVAISKLGGCGGGQERSLTIAGNSVTSAGVCFAFKHQCLPPRRFHNNTAHSCKLGFVVKGGVFKQPIHDLNLWQISFLVS